MDQNDNKEIIDFEDLFKKEIDERKEQRNPEKKKRYGYTLLIYLLMMNVAVAFFYVIFMSVPSFTETFSEDQLILYHVAINEHGLAIMDVVDYHEYQDFYTDYIVTVGTYQNYTVIVNKENTFYEDVLLLDEFLNQAAFVSILNGTLTEWSDDIDIMLIAGKNQILPIFFTADYKAVEGPKTELTSTSFSLLNFVVYVTMLPLIYIMIKKDVWTDFSVAKTWRVEWLSIILVGYVYLILGNIGSNYLSNFFANIFGITAGDSVNQMNIQQAISSNGAIFMVVSAVILGPIVEELVFRKAMFGLFKKQNVGLVVSSLTFGAIHLLGETSIQTALVNGIVYFVMGFVFGYIYLKNNKNLFAPLAVHIVSNLISIIFIFVGFGG